MKQTSEKDSGEEIPKRKIDLKTALSVIPPASQIYGEEKRITEKRIRLVFKNELKEGVALINPELAKELGIEDYLEITVAGRRRLTYKAQLSEEVPFNEVWVNGEKLPSLGIADRTIATVRAKRK